MRRSPGTEKGEACTGIGTLDKIIDLAARDVTKLRIADCGVCSRAWSRSSVPRRGAVASAGGSWVFFIARMECLGGHWPQCGFPLLLWRRKAEANPEGWQRVAGGRSGQEGERPPETVSWFCAPRRGARPNPDVLPLWHPCRGAGHLPGRYPEVAAPRTPPATSGYPLPTLRVERSKADKNVRAPSLRLRRRPQAGSGSFSQFGLVTDYCSLLTAFCDSSWSVRSRTCCSSSG